MIAARILQAIAKSSAGEREQTGMQPGAGIELMQPLASPGLHEPSGYPIAPARADTVEEVPIDNAGLHSGQEHAAPQFLVVPLLENASCREYP